MNLPIPKNSRSSSNTNMRKCLLFFIIIIILESESFYVSGNSKRNNDHYHTNTNSINTYPEVGYDNNHSILKDSLQNENSKSYDSDIANRNYSITSKRGNKITHTISSLNSKSFDKYYDTKNLEKSNIIAIIINTIKTLLHPKTTKNKIQTIIQRTFLPTSYPTKTPKNYLKYILYSSIQDLSTRLRGVLATQRVLEGIGVGKVGATSLSATWNFIVRDGVGMITSLLFTFLVSDKLKSDVKRWRIFADMIVDIGITLEVLAVLVPKHFFLLMICIGNMCKAMCGVASGSCGGVLNLYWAKGTDISDINAKFGAQNTVTGGIGLLFAAFVTRCSMTISSSSNASKISESTIIWTFFASLTAIHLWANMKLMKFVAFDYLNHTRMNIVMQSFINNMNKKDGFLTLELIEESNDALALPSPDNIAKIEPLIFWNMFSSRSVPPVPIRFGISFDTLVISSTSSFTRMQEILSDYDNEEYIIATNKRKEIVVCLKTNASQISKAKAYFHAWILGYYLQNTTKDDICAQEKYVLENISTLWNQFMPSASNAGWDLSQTELGNIGYEVDISSLATTTSADSSS